MSRFAVWRVLTGPGRYGVFFLGAALTNVGTWAQNFAAVLLVHRLTGSAFLVGVVTVAQFAASVLLVRWTGQVADRFDRRAVIGAAQGLSAVITGVLVALSMGGLVTPALMLVTMLALGVCQAFQTPAQLALTPLLVPADQRDIALSLNASQFNLARALGPLIAAFLIDRYGFTVVFAANAASYLIFLLAVLLLRPAAQARSTARGGLRRTLTAIRGIRFVPTLMMITFVVAGATDPVITLGPSFSVLLTGTDHAAGLLVSAFGLGAALSAFFVVPWARRFRRRLVVAMAVQTVGLAALTLAPSVPVALAAAAVIGGAFIVSVNRAASLVQGMVPPELLGRVMAVWVVCFAASRPAFALLDGWLGELLGPRAGAGFGCLALGVLSLVMWHLWHRLERVVEPEPSMVSAPETVDPSGPAAVGRGDHPYLPAVVEVAGVPVRYGVRGRGNRDLLLVHGYQAHSGWWYRMEPLLSENWRVIRIDLSGHGESGHRDHYATEVWVAEILAVLDAAASERAVLVGHSMGGRICLVAAAAHPGRVAGVVTLDSVIRPVARPARPLTPRRAVYASREQALARFRLLPDQLLPEEVLRPVAVRSVRPVDGGWSWKHDLRGVPTVDDAVLARSIADLRVPWRFVYGGASALVDEAAAAHLRATVTADLGIVRMSGVHHHMVLEAPDECARLVDALAREMGAPVADEAGIAPT